MSVNSPYDGSLTLRDLWEVLAIPVALGLAAIVGTWLVWYFTSGSCSQELAESTGCNPSGVADYINLEVFNKAATHAAIAAGGGGLWSYALITRERKAREAAERLLTEVLAQAAEDRARAQAAEDQARAAEERAQFAEERDRFAEERRQFLALLEQFAERSDRDGSSSQ